MAQPAALAIHAQRNVWTANPANNSASEFTSTGIAVSPATGFTSPGIAGPKAIAIDASGKAWLAHGKGSSVTGLTPAGALTGTLSNGLSQPDGIALDTSGDFWVTGSSSVIKFGPKRSIACAGTAQHLSAEDPDQSKMIRFAL